MIPETNEVFTDYEPYLQRMDFYKQRRFICEITGHSGLNFFEAHRSEVCTATLYPRGYPIATDRARWTSRERSIALSRKRSRSPFFAKFSSLQLQELTTSVGTAVIFLVLHADIFIVDEVYEVSLLMRMPNARMLT